MLFETAHQFSAFCFLFLGGLLSGLFSAILGLFGNTKKLLIWIKEFFATIFCCAVFFFINLWTNFGEIRLFAVFSFVLGIFLGFLVKKLFKRKNKKEG